MTRIAYVVVTWNNRGIVETCLQSLLDQTGSAGNVYVIDNASTDGTADLIDDLFPQVRLIRSPVNTGFSRGNNLMIAEALLDRSVEYVALVNSDAALALTWTAEVLAHIGELPNVAAAQGRTLDFRDHEILDSEYIYIGPNLQCVQAGFGQPVGAAGQPRKVFGVNAAAAIFSRAFIEQQPDNNLFDDRFYMYYEDIDVAFRAFMTGWDSYSVPTAIAFHMGSASSRKRPTGYATYMCFRNQSAVMVKNMPASVFVQFLPRAVVSELRRYFLLCRIDGFRIALSALRGRIVGILRAPLYLPARRDLAMQARVSSKHVTLMLRSRGLMD